MGREREVKVLNIDIDKMEDKIISLGGRMIADEYQKNIIFDTGDRLDGYMRIREIRNKLDNSLDFELTIKENILTKDVRENIETTSKLVHIDSMVEILSKLGYNIRNIGYKDRKSYMLDDIRLDLDLWDEKTYKSPYMEIEVLDIEDLWKVIDLLEIDRENITTKSIDQLKKEI